MTGEPVSKLKGRVQGPALRWLTWAAWILAGAGLGIDATWSEPLSSVSVGLVIATPILRVVWLMVRWGQERDLRFVLAGAALLAVVGIGAVLSVARSG